MSPRHKHVDFPRFATGFPIAPGTVCACHGSGAHAHLHCLVQQASRRALHPNEPWFDGPWYRCPLRKQMFVGQARLGLALELRERARGLVEDSRSHNIGAVALADALYAKNNLMAATLQRKVLDAERQANGSNSPCLVVALSSLASMLGAQEQHTEAIALHSEAVDITRRCCGSDHPATLRAAGGMARPLFVSGAIEEAVAWQR